MSDTSAVDARVQVRLDETTASWLADRANRTHIGSHNQQARTELQLWRVALATELRRIRFTLAEASCLADVLNGHLIDAALGSPGVVYAETYDAFRLAGAGVSSYGAKWGINEQDLLTRLQELGPVADHALRDAMSRWWERDLPPTAEGFGEVGLRVSTRS
jgi:hypothetical protein